MKGNKIIVGVYEYLDDVLAIVEKIKARGLDYRVYSPAANHHLEDATFPGKSPVRRVTLTGALTGLTFGFALAILCSMDWPLRVSAKDIVAIPSFFVVGYECTILFGALATLLGVFHFCRLPDVFRKIGYDLRFSDDRFGVAVGVRHEEIESVQKELEESGAERVEVRDGL